MSKLEQLTIAHLGNQGDGLAPYQDSMAVVPFTLSGEIVTAEISQQKEHIYGKITAFITTSPDRIQPPCKHFGTCGGCRLQHMRDDAYKLWKLAAVNHLLEKHHFNVRAEKCFVTPPASRRRASFAVQKNNNDITLGFFERESHVLVAIENCAVIKPQLVALLNPLREVLGTLLTNGQGMTVHCTILSDAIEIVLSGISFTPAQQQQLISWGAENRIAQLYTKPDENAEHQVLLAQSPLIARFGTYDVALPPHAFMQASDEAQDAMLECIKPIFVNAKHCADLFCGSGLFALNFFAPPRTMLAVDVDGAAIDALHKTAQNFRGFTTQRRNLFRDPLKAIELKNIDTVCIDPPRAGAKEQVAEIARSKVGTLAYVSCNPATFIRDAAILVKGGYTLKSVDVFDQFLWSHHIELIGIFKR